MKLTIFFLVVGMLNVAAEGLSQTVTFSGEKVPLKNVLSSVEKQTGFTFFYKQGLLDKSRPITIEATNIPLADFLSQVLKNQPFNCSIKKKNIIISMKPPTGGLSPRLEEDDFSRLDHPPIKISGTVSGLNNQPLAGATVRVKGRNIITISDERGYFELNAEAGSTLVISYVGFLQREYKVINGEPVSISLMQLESRMDTAEVIISTGYQDMKLGKVTGSVVKIDNELFNRETGSNVLDRIANITSGLIAGRGGLDKGNIVIRGLSTYTENGNPLIVVDNFPYDGPIEDINPNDVESVTILKDAAAAAIWGTRAGNGVIVITTKRGRFDSKLNIKLNTNYTTGNKPDLFYIPSLDGKGMVEFETIRFSKGIYEGYDDFFPTIGVFPAVPLSIEILLRAQRDGVADPVNDLKTLGALEALAAHDVRNDINKYLLKRYSLQQHSLSISGGSSKIAYYGSVGYDRIMNGNVKSENKRLTLTWGNNFRALKWLDLNAQIVHSRTNTVDGGVNYRNFLAVTGNSPYARLVGLDGESLAIPRDYRMAYVDTAGIPSLYDWHYRPLDELHNSTNNGSNYDTRISGGLKVSFTPWLKTEFQYQGQLNIIEGEYIQNERSYFVRDGINSSVYVNDLGSMVYPWPKGDVVEVGNGKLKTWNVRGMVNVDKELWHGRLHGLAGIEYRQGTFDFNSFQMFGFDPNTNMHVPVDQVTTFSRRPNGIIQIGSTTRPAGRINRFGSMFSTLTYTYGNRYTISGSARMDQSNNFGLKTNLRKIPLWSASASWHIENENWFDSRVFETLKLRMSYGFTGNTASGSTSFATFTYKNDDFYVPARNKLRWGLIDNPNNPGLKWERVEIVNMGVDFAFKNNRLSGSVEYFTKKGLDLVGNRPVEPTSGFYNYVGNTATMKGRGIDVTLNSINAKIGDFQWKTGFLFSYIKSKVLKYEYPFPVDGVNAIGGMFLKGYPLDALFSFKWAGLDSKTGDPRVFLGDTVSVFDNLQFAKVEDLKYMDTRYPKYFGSLINSFKWRNIGVSFNIIYRLGYSFRRSSINYNDLLNIGWNAHKDFSKRWIKPGDEFFTDVPSLPDASTTLRDGAYLQSDIMVEKGDHIRLQDIRLDYTVKSGLLNRLKTESLNLFIYASNFGLIWKANNQGIDPDAYGFGNVPVSRRITFGLTFNY